MRLISEIDNRKLLQSGLFDGRTEGMIHGPAFLHHCKKQMLTKKYSLNNKLNNTVLFKNISITYRDEVLALHSPYWPAEVNKWITQSRSYNFPSKSVINPATTSGVFLDPTGTFQRCPRHICY